MSQADHPAVLDSDRLSVRSASRPGETAENGQSRFSPEVENSSIPFTAEHESVRATVSEGDTRTISTVAQAVEAFGDYLEAKQNSVLVMRDRVSSDLLVIPHNHRWKEQYRQMTYARLKAAEDYISEKYGDEVPTSLFTLTAPHQDESGDPRPFVSVLEDLKVGWDKARRVIGRHTEEYDTEILTVLEPHQSGYPHLHVLVFGAALPSLGEKIQRYWTERYVDGASKSAQDVSIKNGRSAQLESPAAYVMKYLSKTLIREGEASTSSKEAMPTIQGYKEFSALMWATGSRHYTMTEGLSAAVQAAAPDNEVVGDWEFVGTQHGLDVGLYTGESAEEMSKYLAGSPNQVVPPRNRDYRQEGLPPP